MEKCNVCGRAKCDDCDSFHFVNLVARIYSSSASHVFRATDGSIRQIAWTVHSTTTCLRKRVHNVDKAGVIIALGRTLFAQNAKRKQLKIETTLIAKNRQV